MSEHQKYEPGFIDRAYDERSISRQKLADLVGVSVRTVENWNRTGVPEKRNDLVMAAFDHIDATNWKEPTKPRRVKAPAKKVGPRKRSAAVTVTSDMFSEVELLNELVKRQVLRQSFQPEVGLSQVLVRVLPASLAPRAAMTLAVRHR